MSGTDYLKIWHYAQLAVTLFFMILISAWEAFHRVPIANLVIAVSILLVLNLLTHYATTDYQWLIILMRWLKIIIQPLALVIVWAIVTRQIVVHTGLAVRGVMSLAYLYYVVMFIPYAGTVAKRVTNWYERIGLVLVNFVEIVFLPHFFLNAEFTGPQIYQWIFKSGFFAALAIFATMVTLMRTWHLSWPGIAPKYQQGTRWWIILILLAMIGGYLVILWIAAGPATHQKVIAIFTFHWHDLGITKLYTLTAMEAGVAEESIFRFALIGVLLAGFKQSKFRIPIAIGGSAIVFGSMHLVNLIHGQPLDGTLLQVVMAISMGIFLGCIYLYTGQLWLTMFLHFCIDLLAFLGTNTTAVTQHANGFALIGVTIVFIYFASPLLWLMTPVNRQVMNRHADHLSGTNQHFDYKFNF
ncbi:CPBP family intramembrane glutamic endopeptidase [Limosilactobacillus equigenerosi]|uniref:Immunity protein PlnI n=1 Tax=Limosilactobacillus equigenerosi DSM 18793 = JCM 14505 TaxID=1423742 RepID=A0A0R1UL94_9LACO|nr:type II CAAX endopeptidase family protein [Limosilactobacillus equigenerosi]KRL93975.1 Immunity protein PlnI [Limosilactobacillus equigenerosi DSM 18793 = JCM 14505]